MKSTGKRIYVKRMKRPNGIPFLRESQGDGRRLRRWYIRVDGVELGYLKYMCLLEGINMSDKRVFLKDDYCYDRVPTMSDIIIMPKQEFIEKIRIKDHELWSAYCLLGSLTKTINKCIQESR